ncbi:hypothetical protein BHW_0004800 (plasmid) [Borrelia hermsii MTW]|uniref:Uncharacterized protein n=1 Tax=Borrelia hermsii MTW TaxID=1313291 RepID=W5T656_BORHE|nr:hypothetical protein BHW_0004800 [Borrelia hermsii MTW]
MNYRLILKRRYLVVKVKYYNLLLFLLLLLIISCNLKSKEDGLLGAHLIKKGKPFRAHFTGNKSIDKGFGFKTPVGAAIPVGAAVPVGAAIPVGAAAVKEDVDSASEVVADKSIEVKLDELLSTFNLQDEERPAVNYIRSIVTNPDIPGAKTYTDFEFYDLLKTLDATKVTKIMKVQSKVLRVQREAQVAIENINKEEKKNELQDRFNKESNSYPSWVKSAFSKFTPNDVYQKAICAEDEYDFDDIKEEAESFKEFEDLYAGKLSADELVVIEYIRSVVTNNIVYSYGDVLDDARFNLLLGRLAFDRVKKIIEYHLNTQQAIADINLMVKNIKRERSKQQILRDFNDNYKDSYPSSLRDCFALVYSANVIYNRIIHNNYLRELNVMLNNIRGIIDGEVLYAGLSGDDKIVIESMRNMIISSDVSDGIYDYAYNDFEFYFVLGVLGVDQFRKVIEVNLKEFFRVQKEAEDTIEGINDDELKQKLRRELGAWNNSSKYYLRKALGRGSPYAFDDKIMDNNSEGVSGFIKITMKARTFINYEEISARLSDDERAVIKYLRDILTDPEIKAYPGNAPLQTYSDNELKFLLGGLNYTQVQEMAVDLQKIITLQERIQAVIDSINNEESRKDLNHEFSIAKKEYRIFKKMLFNIVSPVNAYDSVIKIDNSNFFIPVQEKASRIKANEAASIGG